MRPPALAALLAAATAAIPAPALVAAETPAAAPQTVTLGSTAGTPSENICPALVPCTYVPFYLSQSDPQLLVPFDGTVTSFSVNSGSQGNTVELRVLRPSGANQYLGAGTSGAETLSVGVNVFALSLPVKAGDLLAVDNSDSALMFDASAASATSLTDVLRPALSDGATAAPAFSQGGLRLLVSAVVQQATPPPVLSAVSQSHASWREGSAPARFASAVGPPLGTRPPVGTVFRLTLNEAATVRFTFARLLEGRRTRAGCLAPSAANRRGPPCTRAVARGALSFASTAGPHRLIFQGRLSAANRLRPGRWRVTITATNSVGQRSAAKTLVFTIVAG